MCTFVTFFFYSFCLVSPILAPNSLVFLSTNLPVYTSSIRCEKEPMLSVLFIFFQLLRKYLSKYMICGQIHLLAM